ncbi:hypothetical protein F4811DRAFT_551492 [Daldinia bambusicola]|nr:hypothetical protein F4811DRAFT_551492 [Daldinia bambusicola]
MKRAVDVRRIMGVPRSYMGHLVYHASLSLPLSIVASTPLPFLACAMRRALNEVSNSWAVRSYATFLSRLSDRSGLLHGGPHNPETDIGRPAAWRKADHAPILGCLYFFDTEINRASKVRELVLTTMICLANDEMDALMSDTEWTKYFVPAIEPATEVKQKLY